MSSPLTAVFSVSFCRDPTDRILHVKLMQSCPSVCYWCVPLLSLTRSFFSFRPLLCRSSSTWTAGTLLPSAWRRFWCSSTKVCKKPRSFRRLHCTSLVMKFTKQLAVWKQSVWRHLLDAAWCYTCPEGLKARHDELGQSIKSRHGSNCPPPQLYSHHSETLQAEIIQK